MMNIINIKKPPAKNGAEQDAFGNSSHIYKWRVGERKSIKTAYNRRNRRAIINTLKSECFDEYDQ